MVLCSSESMSLLFLVAEALTSLLFPLVWQGAYIPVLPREMLGKLIDLLIYSMYNHFHTYIIFIHLTSPNKFLDVLHAPVPFLVGVHGPYLKEVPSDLRPFGIVFVDLDNDEVHLGTIDNGKGEIYGRNVPALPKKAALKLRSSLDESIGTSYLVTKSRIKGRLTFGYETVMDNSVREEFAYEVTSTSNNISGQGKGSIVIGDNGSRRAMTLKLMDDAFSNEEH